MLCNKDLKLPLGTTWKDLNLTTRDNSTEARMSLGSRIRASLAQAALLFSWVKVCRSKTNNRMLLCRASATRQTTSRKEVPRLRNLRIKIQSVVWLLQRAEEILPSLQTVNSQPLPWQKSFRPGKDQDLRNAEVINSSFKFLLFRPAQRLIQPQVIQKDRARVAVK